MGTPRGEVRADIAIGIFNCVQNVLAGDAQVIQTEIFKLEKTRERQFLCACFAAFFKPAHEAHERAPDNCGRGRPLA